MDSAHIHLLLNHFPVVGTIVIVLVFIYGILIKNDAVVKAALIVTVILALITIPTYLSGESAEGIVKGMDDVTEKYIDPHEDFALYSFIVMGILGVFSLIGLLLFRKDEKFPVWYKAVIFVLLMTVSGMMGYTANLGGKIHHPEIIDGGKTSQQETDDDDDD